MSRRSLLLAVTLLLIANMAGATVLAARAGCCLEEGGHESPCSSSPACDCCIHAAPLPSMVSLGLAVSGSRMSDSVTSEAEGTSADVFHVPRASR